MRSRSVARSFPSNSTFRTFTEAEKTRCNHEREEHMCGRVLTESGNAKSILIICGRLHAEAIAARLARFCDSVEIVDLHDQDWYIEDWQGHML
jgi:hypothetical protein